MFTEKDILKSKTPAEYINRCVNSNIRNKKSIAFQWIKKTGYTSEDIKYARHRHPYWKSKKMEGQQERNRKRFKEYNFLGKKNKHKKWEEEKIAEFLKYNKKQYDFYIYSDREIAKQLKLSIPSIQYWRRKINIAEKIINIIDVKISKKNYIIFIGIAEDILRDIYKLSKKDKKKVRDILTERDII